MGDLRVTAKSQEENGFIYNEIGLSLNSLPGHPNALIILDILYFV
jgi:hypothetical protein